MPPSTFSFFPLPHYVICSNLHCCRLRAVGKASADGVKKARSRDRVARAIPAPEANAELQANLDVSQICCILHEQFYVSHVYVVFTAL